jgi:invasion protein IalB
MALALALSAALAWPGPAPALAQDIQNLGKFGDWRAYAYDEKGEKACYIASQPTKDEGDYKTRGEIYAMVTHRPADKVRDEVSLAAGYHYKTQSRVQVAIDGKTFELFPHEDTAWLPDSAGDRQLVAAMRAGKTMVVQGTSSRGTATKDTYSLIGFTKAYRAASKACGY